MRFISIMLSCCILSGCAPLLGILKGPLGIELVEKELEIADEQIQKVQMPEESVKPVEAVK